MKATWTLVARHRISGNNSQLPQLLGRIALELDLICFLDWTEMTLLGIFEELLWEASGKIDIQGYPVCSGCFDLHLNMSFKKTSTFSDVYIDDKKLMHFDAQTDKSTLVLLAGLWNTALFK